MRFIKKSRKKAGASPGTLVHVGEKHTDRVDITLTEYDRNHLSERRLPAVESLGLETRGKEAVQWIDISGIHDVEIIEAIGREFDVHSLVLEDILNAGHRPKLEVHDDYLYIVLKMLTHDADADTIHSEQLSVILGDGYVISFQEKSGDVFDAVRERLLTGRGLIRKNGSDYLVYALIDAVVDHYFLILEHFSDRIETIEETLLNNPSPEILTAIHTHKREMVFFGKQIRPLRDIVGQLKKGESSYVQPVNRLFFDDVHDHMIQAVEVTESFRDMLTGLQDLCMSTISYKMNEVMKVLTIIATIFIPLTFIAGVYGMNFEHMPELSWRWGYGAVWLVMGGVAAGLVVYFKKKKWF
ncbi:MAG: magnesium/cobalt transporter CorA [Thermodesulfobacteriota bacterium]|nr:magnesium/cobalt transporter CorA [Thermodesulfobacteriota bacterium]